MIASSTVAVFSITATAVFWVLARRAAERRGITFDLPAARSLALAATATLTAFALGTLRGAPFVAAVAGAVVCAITDAETGYIFDDVIVSTLLATLVASLVTGTTTTAIAGALAAGVLFGNVACRYAACWVWSG
jgi:hypothetical protein